jgi:hypothetical protein
MTATDTSADAAEQVWEDAGRSDMHRFSWPNIVLSESAGIAVPALCGTVTKTDLAALNNPPPGGWRRCSVCALFEAAEER